MNQAKEAYSLAEATNYLKERQFDQYFYVDYFGSNAICNGNRYTKKELRVVKKFEVVDAKTGVFQMNVYGVITNTGVKGILKVYKNTDRSKTAEQFINKCVIMEKDL
jgi:hypothetical protein